MVNLAYDVRGTGDPVLFIAGRGGFGRTWHIHQVPAFVAAGYRAVTFDNRGVGATENADGFTTATMVADTAALIEQLGLAPVRIVAVSMGAFIAQELMLARPELVRRSVLMATRGRLDRARAFFQTAEHAHLDSEARLPTSYEAKIRLMESFSPATLNDDAKVRDWIDMFLAWPAKPSVGVRCQTDVAPLENRLPAYSSIATPTLVIGFADDVITPPHLGREVADALPRGKYRLVPRAGHLGFLEHPTLINDLSINFFADENM